MIGIYKITSPNNRIYIGSSINIEKRFKYYKRLQCKNQTKLYNSFKKYNVENHIFEVIQQCEQKDLLDLERYYQDLYNVIDKGLNCVLVKSSDRGSYTSLDTRKKQSKIKKGKKLSNLHRLNISKATKGKNNPNYGKKMSELQKKKISNSKKGFKMSKEIKLKIKETTTKKIGKPLIDLNNGVFYNSVNEYADLYKIHRTTMCKYLKGVRLNKTSVIYA